MISQRDIVLIPFSDQTMTKVRPALILSKDSFNLNSKDVIVCGLTTNLSKDFYSVLVERRDLDEGRIETSMIKAESLAKIEQKLIIKRIAKLNKTKFGQVIENINNLFKD